MKEYCELWDAYFCTDTRKWIEKPCSDPNCYFSCGKRPEKHPSDCTCDGNKVIKLLEHISCK